MSVAVAHQVSATSRKALAQAAREAAYRSTTLAVLHVVESIDPDKAEAYRLGISDEIEKVVEGAQDAGIDWELHLATAGADLADTILELAGKVGAEMLVIGARRRSPVGKALMGSVAQSVILDAEMPVLVVKSDR